MAYMIYTFCTEGQSRRTKKTVTDCIARQKSMKYISEIIAFVSGAVVMILELDGSRIIAPYLGTSIIVWTSLIGIILGSLSFGYWWGGKRADKHADFVALGCILAAAAALVLSVVYLKIFLDMVAFLPLDLITKTIEGTIILFAPATVCLGMVTPYVARLKMKAVETSGQTIGSLYALSTLGSIIGTFLGGFVLISFLRSTKIILILSSTLFLLSALSLWSVQRRGAKKWAIVCVVVAVCIPFLTPPAISEKIIPGKIVGDIDTRYSHVWIYDAVEGGTERPVRYMTNSIYGEQSGEYVDNPSELVIAYTKFFDLASELYPGFSRELMIGAGAYSYPKHFIKTYPSSSLDVVEIDPELEELAKKYFSFAENPRVRIFNEDGRTFLNRNSAQYNVIINDAFLSDSNIPFQLTTEEATRRMYDSLDDKGVVIANLVVVPAGPKSSFFQAEYATYKKIFPVVYALQVAPGFSGTLRQNIILVARKSVGSDGYPKNAVTPDHSINVPILTDEFAPTEKYLAQMLF